MSIDTEKFTIELVKAIDNWQAGSLGKARKARQLQIAGTHLGEAYRSCPSIVYRQFRVNKTIVLPMAINQRFAETISSWTTSVDVAKHFRETEVDQKKILMIYTRAPQWQDIILNLNDIYADPNFIMTVKHYERGSVLNCEKGIRRHKGSQYEVILDETDMRNDDVAFIGTYRTLEDVVPTLGQPSADAGSDEDIMEELTGVGPYEIFWAPRSSAGAALQQYVNRSKELLNRLPSPKVWEESDTDQPHLIGPV